MSRDLIVSLVVIGVFAFAAITSVVLDELDRRRRQREER